MKDGRKGGRKIGRKEGRKKKRGVSPTERSCCRKYSHLPVVAHY